MNIHHISGAGRLGLAAAAVLAAGLTTANPAIAGEPARTASVAGDTLTVTASNKADRVALRLAAGDPTTLQVDFDDDGVSDGSFDRGSFTRIAVFLGNGDDAFRVDQANGAFGDEALTVDGGNGNDTIAGGDGAEVLAGGNGADAIDGNRGADTGVLGRGQDSFTWDPGDGSDIVDGGEGYDALVFNGANVNEVMSLSADGARSVFLRDAGNIKMDMIAVEALDLAALGGTDNVTINDLSGTGFRHANIDLGGDGQADVVTVNGTAASERIKVDARATAVEVDGFAAETTVTGSESSDRLHINGQGGDDSARIGQGVSALIGVTLDLG